MSKTLFPNSHLVTTLFALPFAGAGVLIMLVAADVIHSDPASIHAPRWVLGAAGFVFFIAGVWRCVFWGMGILMGLGTIWFAVKRPMQILGYHSDQSKKENEE